MTLSGLANKIARILCIVGLLALTGCATADETGRIRWEINNLQTEVNKIKKATQSPAGRKLQALQDSQKATAQTVSDQLIHMQNLTSEFQVITGRFEEYRYQSEKNITKTESDREMLLARIEGLEKSIAELNKKLAEIKTVTAPKVVKKDPAKKKEPVKKKGKTPVEKNGEIKDLYMTAYQDVKAGKTADARTKFSTILESYPENEYSDNARFWIGESYYKDGNYEDAILAYEELFQKNPKSDKIPGAMLKQGLAFYSLEDKKTGKIILEKLIEKYPGSEPAVLAKRKITKAVPPKKKK